MNDLGRRAWVAKENRSPKYFGGMFILGLILLLAGFLFRSSFVEGLGTGLVAVMGFALVALKVKR